MQNEPSLEELLERLARLQEKQNEFQREISQLRNQLRALNLQQGDAIKPDAPETPLPKEMSRPTESAWEERAAQPSPQPLSSRKKVPKLPKMPKNAAWRENFESFVGTNLVSKVGILITVIGVAIGAKYAIDNELISPLTRIVLSYAFGAGLLAVALYLKASYEKYSAVLLSGALAIFYFTTYIAFDFYALFPPLVAFVLMLVFTGFGIVAALAYQQQVIAVLGLVGAYAVPFLVNTGSGNVTALFTYILLLNTAILVVSIYTYWKVLFYLSFAFTWAIASAWYVTQYKEDTHFTLALVFFSLFFLIFYAAFIAYKLKKRQLFVWADISLLLANSFVYFGLGYLLLSQASTALNYVGLFTLANALVHFAVGQLMHIRKTADTNLFYLVVGMVLVFLTLAVPIQLKSNWITLLWAGEAALLFYIGTRRRIAFYRYAAYPLTLLAFGSLLLDWQNSWPQYTYDYTTYENMVEGYSNNERTLVGTLPTPFFNATFLTALLVLAAFGIIFWQYRLLASSERGKASRWFGAVLTVLLGIVAYHTFLHEIQLYWTLQFEASLLNIVAEDYVERTYFDYSLRQFGTVWAFVYTLLFMAALNTLNARRWQQKGLASFNFWVGGAVVLLALLSGLYKCSELRQTYIEQENANYYVRGLGHLLIRYVLYAALAASAAGLWQQAKHGLLSMSRVKMLRLFLYGVGLFVASSELLHQMSLEGYSGTYKLGLSILWGTYALGMIGVGIWQKQKVVRVAGIALFVVTLIKLFFYDIADLNTLSKVVVFISLGILLLIASFLYNKYKDLISDDQ